MENILNDIDKFISKDIYEKDNFVKLINNMIYTNFFDLTSTIAIFLQNEDTILAYSEWKISRYNYLIYEDTIPLIVPIPTEYFTFGSENKDISLATNSEKEQILLGNIKTFKNIAYNNYVFYDLKYTNCKEYDNFLFRYYLDTSDKTIQSIMTLCEKSGVIIKYDDLNKLKISSLYSSDTKTIFIEKTLHIKDSMYNLMQCYFKFLFEQTSLQNENIQTFEYNLCLHILVKKFHLAHQTTFTLTNEINIQESVARCFKMCNFFISKINDYIEENIDFTLNDTVLDEEPDNKKRGLRKKEGSHE